MERSGHERDGRADDGVVGRTDAVPDDHVSGNDQASYAAEPSGAESGSSGDQPYRLLSDREADEFLDRWREVQARFIDDPRAAVQDGDALVAELMRFLTNRFSDQKSALEERWSSGSQPKTEQLRRVLQEYRSFFERLLST